MLKCSTLQKKKKALKRSRTGYPVGPDGRSPPRQYRHHGGAAEEGEVEEFSDQDGRNPHEPSDIFHRPGLKYRDKGSTYGPDPGGGRHDPGACLYNCCQGPAQERK